jgi:predicted GNAT superfamily acetyltransferase
MPASWTLDSTASLLAVEIPVNFQAMIDQVRDTHARPWREHTRAVLEAGFAAGYAVSAFVLTPDGEIHGAQRAFYLLERQP